MKIGKGRGPKTSATAAVGRPTKNNSKRNLYILVTVLITALLIVWVYSMGRKAEETVTVCMTSQSIYKNQLITDSMIQPYDMLKGEFEKFSTVTSGGTRQRRILLYSEKDLIVNSFAAYPLQANNYCEYRAFIKSRVDNSDSVLYSFPGKDIVALEMAANELQTFKTFLQPGDRVNITAIYSEKEQVEKDDGFGGTEMEEVTVYKTESAFQNILIADLLNNSGDSVLDIYEDYNMRTTYQQAQLDASTTFQQSVEPADLLVALTPEELYRYYYLLKKENVEFKMSLPQRVE